MLVRWKIGLSKVGGIFVFKKYGDKYEEGTLFTNPIVAVANEVKGYPIIWQEDVDLLIASNSLHLPEEFKTMLINATIRENTQNRRELEVREELIFRLKPIILYAPPPNSIRVST